MRLRTGLLAMTFFAVISDALLIPFYPQFFSERYGLASPFHVGAYVAAISVTVMGVFPLWVRIARKVETLHILQYTQGAAALLCVASFYAPNAPTYWLLSLAMFAFKSSYLLNFPYLMRLETDDTRAATIGALSVVAHAGVIVGAVAGGLAIESWGVGACVLLMAGADLVQMGVCTYLIRSRRMVRVLDEAAPERAAPRRFSLRGHALVLRLAVVMLLFDFSAAVVRPFFSLYWTQVSALANEAVAGFVFAVPKVVAVVALWVHHRFALADEHPLRRTLGNLALGALGLAMQAAPDASTVVVGRVLLGWSLYQLVINFDLKLYALSTPDDFGRDYGVINIFQNTGVLIASFAAGSLVAWQGPRAPFVVAALGFALAALLWQRSFGGRSAAAGPDVASKPSTERDRALEPEQGAA